MTPPAGSSRKGMLSQDDYLAPPHIPTGQPPKDVLNIIWRKNEVYLDIGNFSMVAGWLTLHWGTFLITVISIWIALTTSDRIGLAIVTIPMFALMGALWYFFSKQWRKPLTPPIRFNRQRREVCITEPDGSYWFVPWERVYAIAPSVTNLGTYGATKHGSLLLWFPLKGQEHETYGPDKKGWVLMVNPGGGISSMAQWECIRSFMDVGPDAAPDPSIIRNKGMSLWQSFTHDFRTAVKSRGWLLAFLWEGLGSVVFNGFLLEHLLRKKLAHIPDLTAPEVVEWSKSLPPEQWAKRSPELERAIAEREAELAAQ
jgi:hypothetical protein